MNKLFPLHEEAKGPSHNRPYYSNTWEPITFKNSTFPNFQYHRTTTEYFYCGQVIGSSETDKTSLFLSATQLITAWTHSGSGVFVDNGKDILVFNGNSGSKATSNVFTLTSGDIVNFRVDGTISSTSSDHIDAKVYNASTLLDTVQLHTGKNELTYTSTVNSSDYKVVLELSGSSNTLASATITCGKCVYEIHNDYLTYNGKALLSTFTSGISTFVLQDTTHFYTEVCNLIADSDTYLNDNLLISISSSVDYADIYYKGGFIQKLYRYANVRRSPSPNITVIGDERNGVIIREKVISATKYQVKIKCTEAMLDALTASVGADVTITDQTGKVFTVNNLELEKPEWYGTNGVVTLTFDDNINVFTENSTDL